MRRSAPLQFVDTSYRPLTGISLAKASRILDLVARHHASTDVIQVYRGETEANMARRLFSDRADSTGTRLLNRAFYFGDKARHFYMRGLHTARRHLVDINDCSAETTAFIFQRIGMALRSDRGDRIRSLTREPFIDFFERPGNAPWFIDKLDEPHDPRERIAIRDYYLYFLHSLGRTGIRDESMLVSTSTKKGVARFFVRYPSTHERFVIHYIVPKPFENHAIAPWTVLGHQHRVESLGLPVYNPIGTFPEQYEVSVKGALFPQYMPFIEAVGKKVLVVNPSIRNMGDDDFSRFPSAGIPIDQSRFAFHVRQTGYRRWGQADGRGDMQEFDNE